MPTEVAVGKSASFPPGTHKVVNVNGREIGIFNVDGRFYGLPNICPHQIGPLCRGRVSGTLTATEETGWRREWVHEGEIITCPWHGLEFHIPSGQCMAYPQIHLRSYEVFVKEDEVVIRL